MNILHVLSQFEVTGAEVYAVTLAKEQRRHGNHPIFVSDTLHTPTDAPVIQLSIGERSYLQRAKNIASLIRLIREHDIHVVHAHSRAASWVSMMATRLTGTPFVSSVHGRQHLHFSSTLFSVYGRHVIAVSESLKDHLVKELGLRVEEIEVIPNGIDLETWRSKKKSAGKIDLFGVLEKTKVVLFVGRLTGPKGDVVRFLVSQVLPEVEKITGCVLCVVGGLKVPNDIPALIESANQQLGRKTVILKEFQPNIASYLRAADVIIASGRVAVESLLAGKPTIAFGETNYHGRITEETFDLFARTNFGDTGMFRQADSGLVSKELVELMKDAKRKPNVALQRLASSHYDVKIIGTRVQEVYERAVVKEASPGFVPVLMYHRVVENPPADSRHGLWVTREQFRRQMTSLAIRGYTPITFTQYLRFAHREAPLPNQPIILTFDDGYEDNYRIAFPILQEFGFHAVIFLVTDKKRRTNFWDPDEPQVPLLKPTQVREMARHQMEFGSHTVSHLRIPGTPEQQLRRELRESKAFVEDLTGYEAVSFAYPYGLLDGTAKRLVAEESYTFAVAGDSGPLRFTDDFHEIRRTQVFPGTGSFGFWKKTQPWYTRYKSKRI
ncbi:MAG: polysaccharide deacetylase family protein [Ignavibacteriales bacterium]|nr:polysaccharide deacetylase family protein [Ignavibacteriales bacterium]